MRYRFRGLLGLVGLLSVLIVQPASAQPTGPIRNVFVIVMENHDWADIKGNPAAPNINKFLGTGSYAEQYTSPDGLHPSLPNYIWMEAGDNLGITDDVQPQQPRLQTANHLTALLQKNGISWKFYQEDIPGTDCPLQPHDRYVPRHNPAVYFDDNTDGWNSRSPSCIAHVRPFQELFTDLAADNVAGYNFITPNLCNDMHDCDIATGDRWLGDTVSRIQASKAYQRAGVIFLTFDESEHGASPIGMVVLSPFAKGGGYSNNIRYTHSSLLRSVQEILNVHPYLRNAADAQDLSDLFTFPLNMRIVNSATYRTGAIAPGEIVTLFGTGVGPEEPRLVEFDANGRIASKCGKVRMLFDGVPVPIIYAGHHQISAIVPFEAAVSAVASVVLEVNGNIFPALELPVAAVSPGLFQSGTPGNYAAAVNQDNTINSPDSPSDVGSIVILYLNGAGKLAFGGVTGEIASKLVAPEEKVTVTIGGKTAEVLYAGTAPEMVSSVLQVNVRIPQSIETSVSVPVVVKVGNSEAPVVNIAVR